MEKKRKQDSIRKAELINEDFDKSTVVGTITLSDDGKITGVPIPGEENTMKGVLSEPNFGADGNLHFIDKDPVGWFEALPNQYHGTYFWARIVEPKAKSKPKRPPKEDFNQAAFRAVQQTIARSEPAKIIDRTAEAVKSKAAFGIIGIDKPS